MGGILVGEGRGERDVTGGSRREGLKAIVTSQKKKNQERSSAKKSLKKK